MKTHNSTKNATFCIILIFPLSFCGKAVWAGPGSAHVTAFTTVFYGIQPPSQSSKDVGRFYVAASQHQVAITGQQGTLNNPSTFCKEKRT